ncbi:RDD family protein [Haloprofundus halobius]|uniref:RDD family protein n=1 Tax=Haloprofundus halobius TaxID=2876194 RepID=UPI001CCF2AA6|nr:RDD family protein [Haloprofundus halobius]
MTETDLRLFGSIHADRRGKVAAELAEFADGVDALFVEMPATNVTYGTYLRAFCRTPLVGLGLVLAMLVHYPVYALLQRSPHSVERLAVAELVEEWGVNVHGVDDDHPVVFLADAGPKWILPNWTALAALLVYDRSGALATVALLVGAFAGLQLVALYATRLWAVVTLPLCLLVLHELVLGPRASTAAVGVVAVGFLSLVLVGIDTRNETMVDRIAEVSADRGYEDVCLTTGNAHLSGLLDSDDVDVRVSKVHTSKWLRRSAETVENPEPTGASGPETVGDVGTEQHVLGARIGAAVVDGVVTLVVGFVLFVGMGLAVSGLSESAFLSRMMAGVGIMSGFVVTPTLAAVLYGYVAEHRYGRTLGKRLFGLVVVGTDGTRCTRRAAALRNLLRPVDFVFLYTVGFVTMLATPRRQRLGDLVAGTTVVRAAETSVPVRSPTRRKTVRSRPESGSD